MYDKLAFFDLNRLSYPLSAGVTYRFNLHLRPGASHVTCVENSGIYQ